MSGGSEKWKNGKKLKVLKIASLKLYEVEVVVLFFLLAQEDVVDHVVLELAASFLAFLKHLLQDEKGLDYK